MISRQGSISLTDAREKMSKFFNTMISLYEVREKNFIGSILNGNIKASKEFEDLSFENFPMAYHELLTKTFNIPAEAQALQDENNRKSDDKLYTGMSNEDRYGLFYEGVEAQVLYAFLDNSIDIGEILLAKILEKPNKIEMDTDLFTFIKKIRAKDFNNFEIESVGKDLEPGDFRLTVNGKVKGYYDTKSMNYSSLNNNADKLYEDVLKKMKPNENFNTYPDFKNMIYNSLVYGKKIPPSQLGHNVLFFNFRDKAIWTSELLKDMKDVIIDDWMVYYMTGKLDMNGR